MMLAALTLLVRLPGITRPLLGNFATKSAVYGMIARNWVEGHAPWYRPTLDCLIEGRPGWHLLEVPLSAYVAGSAWQLFGGTLDFWGRLTSALFYTVGVLFLWHLMQRWHSTQAAWAAALAMALAPVGVVYGQTFMLESSAVCFVLGSLFYAQRWQDTGLFRMLLACGLCVAAALLTKIYLAAMLLPVALLLLRVEPKSAGLFAYVKSACRATVALPAMLTIILAAAPALLWHLYVAQLTSGVDGAPVYYSVRNSLTAHAFPHPMLTLAEFYRHLLDDLATVVLTPVGLVLAVLGVAQRSVRQHWGWIVSAVVMVIVLPLKFYEMNYYFLPLLPLLAVFVGLGWERLAARGSGVRNMAVALGLVALVYAARYSVKPAFVHAAEDRAVLPAARAVKNLSTSDQRVVTMHGTSLDLLYYCERRGWAISPKARNLATRLEQCASAGAALLVVTPTSQIERSPQLKSLVQCLSVAESGDGFVVYRLNPEL